MYILSVRGLALTWRFACRSAGIAPRLVNSLGEKTSIKPAVLMQKKPAVEIGRLRRFDLSLPRLLSEVAFLSVTLAHVKYTFIIGFLSVRDATWNFFALR